MPKFLISRKVQNCKWDHGPQQLTIRRRYCREDYPLWHSQAGRTIKGLNMKVTAPQGRDNTAQVYFGRGGEIRVYNEKVSGTEHGC